MKPLFTIVTVCFNSEKTIERTIKSILFQDFKDYEYLIIDGASKDNTIDIVKQMSPLFENRLKWISEPDKGIYDAFNKGCKMATGLYVWIVNSDDYVEPDALSKLKDIIDANKSDTLPVISSAMRLIDEDTGKTISIQSQNSVSSEECFQKDCMNIIHPATIVPKSIYEEHGYFDDRYKLLADCEWAHRVYGLGVPFLFTDMVITNMSNAGISNQWNWKRYSINLHDRLLYFGKYYEKPLIRYTKLIRWHYAFIKEFIKYKIL